MSKSLSDLDTGREWALPRRDFLVLGSTAVVCAAASSVTGATVRAIAMPAAGAVLSVGYAEPALDDAIAATNLISARSLRLVDSGFNLNGARIVVHGLSRPEGRSKQPASIRLNTFAPNAGAPAPFLAWSYSMDRRGRSTVGRRVSFVAALDDDGTLPLAVERHALMSLPSRRLGRLMSFARNSAADHALPNLAAMEQDGSVCRLSSGDRGDVRLRRGMYFLALRESSADRPPDWSSVVVDRKAADLSANGALLRYGRPVDFEYIALTVDYATI